MGSARTIFFGSGSFALPALAALPGPGPAAGAVAHVVAVVTAPARPAGRHGLPRATPVAEAAQARAVPVLTPATLRDEEAREALRSRQPELIVLADYGRLIPHAVLAMPRHGALNLHPSLLPRHRGASPIAAAIMAADSHTGVTLMHMDEGLDSGPILAQRELALDGSELAPDLEARLARLAADLLVETLPAWLDGSLRERAQPLSGATLTRPLRRADGRLDPRLGAAELERQVRAYQPWPGSFIHFAPENADPGRSAGDRLIVWRATAIPGQTAPPATAGAVVRGEIIAEGDTVALRTTDGLLRLDEVQPPGGRRMSGAEYRRGRGRRGE